MFEPILDMCNEMKLFGIRNSAERRVQQAIADNLHPSDLLRLLLEDESDNRKAIKAKRLTTRAKFRKTCDLSDWDTSFDRGVTRAKLKDLAALNFFHRSCNLHIYGKKGEGKTHLAMALGKALCNQGVSVQFFSVNLLLEEVQANRAAGKYLAYLNRLKKIQTLILDDFGLRDYNHQEATFFLELIEERYGKGIIITTSQVEMAGWKNLFEDPVITEAIFDRLQNPSETLTLKGGSYRAKL